MPAANREIVDRVYDGWRRGDFSVGVEEFAPDATLLIDPEIPDAGEYEGVDGIRHYVRHFLSAWESLTIEPVSFSEAGDDALLVRVIQKGVGRGSGVAASLDYFHLWRFRGGRIVRLESILREDRALEAARLT